MESFIGRDVGKYHIVEQLGEGGMSVVYKAFDTSLDRFVAIKFIRKETIGERYYPEMLQRFDREAKVLASLDHPYIVTIFDYGQYQGSPYLVEKFIPSGPLRPAGRPIPYSDAASLLAPVARALEYAHRRGVIHRDIKPSNILIRENGDPILSDFGIAKILDPGSFSEGDGPLTSTGVYLGTPGYMAPEQWQGKPTAQSDIYGLGLILYELITGRLPYPADTPAAVMLKQATEPLPRPRRFVPDLPEALEKVIFKALAIKPENRYASMGEFAAALEQLAHGAPPRKPIPARLAFGRARQSTEEKARVQAAERSAEENKQRQATEDKVRRMATILVAQEAKQRQAAEPVGHPEKKAGFSEIIDQFKGRHVTWPILLAGGGVGLIVLILLGSWLASAAFGSANRGQTETATSVSFPAAMPLTQTETPSTNPTETATETPVLSQTQNTPTQTITLTFTVSSTTTVTATVKPPTSTFLPPVLNSPTSQQKRNPPPPPAHTPTVAPPPPTKPPTLAAP